MMISNSIQVVLPTKEGRMDKPIAIGFSVLERRFAKTSNKCSTYLYRNVSQQTHHGRILVPDCSSPFWKEKCHAPVFRLVFYVPADKVKCTRFSDTDSFYIQFSDHTWEEAVSILKSKIDFSNLPPDHKIFENLDYEKYASSRKAQFSFVKIDTGAKIIRAFLGEKKKSYNLFFSKNDEQVGCTDLDRKTTKKGCPGAAAEKLVTKDLLGLIKKPGTVRAGFNKLQSKNHIISMIHQEKMVTNSFDSSAYYKKCNMCNIPFDCDLKHKSLCKSIDCEKNKLLVKIWHRNLE